MQGRKHQRGSRQKYSPSFREQVVLDYVQGDLSYQQVAEKYGLRGRYVVRDWVRWYRKNSELVVPRMNEMSDQEKQDQETLARRIEELERQLSDERLRSLAYSTMIDVAEEELGIVIRKKSGTKQSKS